MDTGGDMSYLRLWFVSLFTVAAAAVSCGIGQESPFSLVPADTYYMVNGRDYHKMMESPIIKNIRKKWDEAEEGILRIEQMVEKSGVDLEQFGMDLSFHADDRRNGIAVKKSDLGPQEILDIASAFRNSISLSEERVELKFYGLKDLEVVGTPQGEVMLWRGSNYYLGESAWIQECIDVAAGKKASVETNQKFLDALDLVDLSASEVWFVWGKSTWPMEDILSPLSCAGDLQVFGYSQYYGEQFRVVARFRFNSAESALTAERELKADEEKFIKIRDYNTIMWEMFVPFPMASESRLAMENFQITSQDNILNIELTLSWEDFLEAHEQYFLKTELSTIKQKASSYAFLSREGLRGPASD
jgi:hypothetical protein